MKTDKKIIIAILLMNTFIAFLGDGMIIPVLPTLMKELDLTGATAGYLVATYAVAQLIISPIAGRWIDQKGRKPFIIIGLGAIVISQILFGLGQSALVLYISRIFGGIGAGLIMPAVFAFLTDVTTLKERAKVLGYLSAAINTGLIIGPGLGGTIAEINIRLPFYISAVVGCVAVVCSIFLLKEINQPSSVNEVENNADSVQTKPIRKLIQPIYFYPLFLMFISSLGLAFFDSFLSLYVDVKFGFTPKDIGIMILIGAVIGLIAQVLLFEKLTELFGEIKLTRYIFMVSVIFVLLMTVANSYVTVMLIACVLFVGFDLIRPATTSYLSKNAGNDQGFVAGVNSMLTSFANILGPVIGGILFDIQIDYPFYLAAIVLVGGLLLSISWKESKF